MRLALCQLDTVVGDIDGNVDRVLAALRTAEASGAQLAVYPELTLTGYPPEDLVAKPDFVARNLAALEAVASSCQSCFAVVGFVDDPDGVLATRGDAVTSSRSPLRSSASEKGGSPLGSSASEGGRSGMRGPGRLRNAVALCGEGKVLATYHKRLLPNYGVFDERRWFAPGDSPLVVYEVHGVRVGLSICEDLWFSEGPLGELGAMGAELIVNVNASPYSIGRQAERRAIVAERVAESGAAIAYVNQVGGQDELVFDGGSMLLDASGALVAEVGRFSECVLVTDLDSHQADSLGATKGKPHLSKGPADGEEEEVYQALVLGTRDYISKNGFSEAVLGLSGGIDSALVAVLAADAIGPEQVHALAMPSRYSSAGSVSDAEAVAENLGIQLWTVPIEDLHQTYSDLLEPVLGSPLAGLADENLQSRLRGVMLMAVSNARGWIVLTTGNKSEVAVGYSTLYGDSAGGFAVIRDVPKTLVYRLAHHVNLRAGRELIPASVLTKPPSAELRPDQRDDQSLPPYEVLDPLIQGLVEEDMPIDDLVAAGYDLDTVLRVSRLVDAAEYKRRQSPPGVRITARAFGKDRRMPITNRFLPRPDAQGAGSDAR